MRILVNCPSGESRLLQVDDSATVADLKHTLCQQEGIPVMQQVLVFAGQPLKDHLLLTDHGLEGYTLSDEVVLYLSKKLLNPKRIFLTSRARLSQKIAEAVEADMPCGEVMGLLESRSLATQFSPGARIYAKRGDGSTIPMTVEGTQSVASLENKIAQLEGVAPTALTFLQAQDGAMHVIVWPSTEASKDTYPVYVRDVKPQPEIPVKDPSTGQPLPELTKELCVHDR